MALIDLHQEFCRVYPRRSHLPIEPLEEAALLPAVLRQGAFVELTARIVLARGRELDATLPVLAQGGPVATVVVVVVAVLAWRTNKNKRNPGDFQCHVCLCTSGVIHSGPKLPEFSGAYFDTQVSIVVNKIRC